MRPLRVAALVVCLFGCNGQTPTSPTGSGANDTPAPEKKAEPKTELPYAECKDVMQWFKENAGDPDSIEVLKWERRVHEEEAPLVKAGTVMLFVKHRGRNQYGGKSVEERVFYFNDGKLSWSHLIE